MEALKQNLAVSQSMHVRNWRSRHLSQGTLREILWWGGFPAEHLYAPFSKTDKTWTEIRIRLPETFFFQTDQQINSRLQLYKIEQI